MIKGIRAAFLVFFLTLFISVPGSFAHFGMVIPSDQMVMQGEDPNLNIDLMFWHPFEGVGMDLEKPANFSVFENGTPKDLTLFIHPQKTSGFKTWSSSYKLRRPGVYMFVMEPEPYWEPSEDSYIVHYTKTVVTAYGDDEGWDRELGLKTEIVPLSKPYGLYTGNAFQGIVKVNGKAVPGAMVEIEHYNVNSKYTAPTDYMITQTVKADSRGIFTYVAPKPGWWGFSALTTSPEKMKHGGVDKNVEIGAVLWAQFHDMK